jgi:AraC-like DNA-binding protein
LFTREGKYQYSVYTVAQIERCYLDLHEVLEKGLVYKETSLTLPKLANQLRVSPNLLSEAINKKSGQNFPDFINGYRIREAQRLLKNLDYDSHKIAAIAFETGFNSLSVFNAAFKRVTSMTPSAFRKAHFKR